MKVFGKPMINHLICCFYQGYKIIFSNADAWRMDCGFGPWIEGSDDKCSDYAGANLNLANCFRDN